MTKIRPYKLPAAERKVLQALAGMKEISIDKVEFNRPYNLEVYRALGCQIYFHKNGIAMRYDYEVNLSDKLPRVHNFREIMWNSMLEYIKERNEGS